MVVLPCVKSKFDIFSKTENLLLLATKYVYVRGGGRDEGKDFRRETISNVRIVSAIFSSASFQIYELPAYNPGARP